MRICTEKSTGKLIESQSGGGTHPNPEINDKEYAEMNLETLRQNAINAGYMAEDVEVKFITDEEFQTILAAIPQPEPTQDEIYKTKVDMRIRELAIESLKKDGELPLTYDENWRQR